MKIRTILRLKSLFRVVHKKEGSLDRFPSFLSSVRDSTFFPYHTIRISFNGKGSLCSAMHISHGIIIKRNFARCLRAFYGSGLSLKGMLLRVTCFIAHQPGTPRGLTLTLRLNEK